MPLSWSQNETYVHLNLAVTCKENTTVDVSFERDRFYFHCMGQQGQNFTIYPVLRSPIETDSRSFCNTDHMGEVKCYMRKRGEDNYFDRLFQVCVCGGGFTKHFLLATVISHSFAC